MSLGTLLLTKLCREGNSGDFLKAKLQGKYFRGDEVAIWEFVSAFAKNHGAMPSTEVLEKTFGSLDDTPDPLSYYAEALEERWSYGRLDKVLTEADEVMHGNASKTEKLQDVNARLREALDEMYTSAIRHDMIEFGQEGYPLMFENLKKVMSGQKGIMFGWPTLDNQSGGLWGGDVVSYIGRPGMGKTYKMLWTAHHSWWHQKQDTMFVSMEMPIPAIADRLAALHSHFSVTKLKKGDVATGITGLDEMAKLKASAIEVAGHPAKLWVIDGGLTATPDEIFALARYLKVKLVLIDGAYLMKNRDPRLSRWDRMADNAETVKRLTQTLGVATICSYQFSKEMAKKKKESEEVGLEDIYGADAVAQTSSIVLGLFEGNTVATMKIRKVLVLKGREGQTGGFSVRWIFDGGPGQQPMDFSECDPDSGFPIDEDSI